MGGRGAGGWVVLGVEGGEGGGAEGGEWVKAVGVRGVGSERPAYQK